MERDACLLRLSVLSKREKLVVLRQMKNIIDRESDHYVDPRQVPLFEEAKK
jgi:hypothetical protein